MMCLWGVFMTLCVVAVFSCTSETELYRENDNKFSTYDFATAQELSFVFAQPHYLPLDLNDPPVIYGDIADKSTDGNLSVQVTYQRVNDTTLELEGAVRYTASNFVHVPGNSESSSVFEIKGISITQLGASIDVSNVNNEPRYLDGFSFWWNSEGVYYALYVYGYNNDEAIKIVESMIL